MSEKRTPLTESDLELYFVIDGEDNNLYLKNTDESGYYVFKPGNEGAEIFTAAELKELFNEPENEGLAESVGVIKVKDALEMVGENADECEVITEA